MSLINEYLYTNKDLSNIDIDSYLEKLINNLKISYPKVQIDFRSEKIPFNFDNALSLGIIVNEVLTNSIKHNSDKDGLRIEIELKINDGVIYLYIKDNGKGFENIQKQGLGLKLVNQFCKKLTNSQSEFSFENGTKFELSFESKD
jgi:two-component sensor histidine kinase